MHILVEEDCRSTELIFLSFVVGCTALAMALTALLQDRMDRPHEFISNFILADRWFAIIGLCCFMSVLDSSFSAIFSKNVPRYIFTYICV